MTLRRPVVRDVDRPSPLLRTTHSICHPGEAWPVRLEAIVLAEKMYDDDNTATRDDVPELAHGSWKEQIVGPHEVFTRLLGVRKVMHAEPRIS